MFRIIFIIVVMTTPALSYSTGAPTEVCKTMAPKHGPTVSQTSVPPYVLQVPSSIKAGEKISITLKGQSGKDTIKGFVVQARVGEQSVGTFIPGANSQSLDCGATANALTHKKITEDINEIKFEWIAPNTVQQTIEFVATVVQRGDFYWVKGVRTTVAVV